MLQGVQKVYFRYLQPVGCDLTQMILVVLEPVRNGTDDIIESDQSWEK